MENKKSSFQFKTPQLDEISFRTNHDFKAGNSVVEIVTNTTTKITKTHDNEATVSISMMIGDDNAPFSMSLSMTADFRWEDEINDVADELLRTNAPALLISYARPIIAGITGASSLPAFHLPYLNMSENEVEGN